jgi:dolichol-phosphate mannosyltransferase
MDIVNAMEKLDRKKISIVVPIYNEEDNINELYDSVNAVMHNLSKEFEYEFMFTDNHSTDRSFEILSRLAEEDKKVKVIRFSKNFGYQKSILTGYLNASGDAAIQLDCDMQDPPSMIVEFLRFWEEGYNVVYGIRVTRNESFIMHSLRKIFYRMINFLSEENLPLDAGDFRLIDRKIIEELRKIEDNQPYIRGTIATLGYKQIGLPYKRDERKRGKSKFSLKHLVQLAIDGIVSHSIIPLRIATYTGLVISVFNFFAFICYFIAKLFLGAAWPAGFTTITLLLLLSIGLNAVFLGIIGEYLGRIYIQTRKRPLIIISEKINI